MRVNYRENLDVAMKPGDKVKFKTKDGRTIEGEVRTVYKDGFTLWEAHITYPEGSTSGSGRLSIAFKDVVEWLEGGPRKPERPRKEGKKKQGRKRRVTTATPL